MSKALDGVRILDFTHVQSGPTCTQLLAWFGADVIKVERPGIGDITRGQLRDIPDVDSLYFTMLNHNKRSITLDTKNSMGKAVLETLVKSCDVLVENFAPGVLDRMGFTWERIQELNPRMIVASVKGFGPGPYEDCNRLRRRAAARHRRPDRRQRHRAASRARHRRRALSAQHHRAWPKGPRCHAGRRAQSLPRQAA
jgi:crotonobetainyl-CoA:carnitine CoA-transferase CaiB-like acyl-CoA transferase